MHDSFHLFTLFLSVGDQTSTSPLLGLFQPVQAEVHSNQCRPKFIPYELNHACPLIRQTHARPPCCYVAGLVAAHDQCYTCVQLPFPVLCVPLGCQAFGASSVCYTEKG